tara:strand:- start:98 stop:703 length:606 start_codon:yes stop_codon:yes gene_type:complete
MSRATVNTAEFEKTMQRYLIETKKDITVIVNTKAYWVAYNAIRYTGQAKKPKINRFVRNWKKSGPTIIKAFGLKTDRSGGWTRKEVMQKFGKLRHRSVSFLQSGWVPTLQATFKQAKRPPYYKGVWPYGKKKGHAKVLKRPWETHTTISNKTGFKPDQATAARRYVRPALSRAVGEEAASMRKYLEEKQKKILRKVKIKHR